jgi:hypothetical protein
MARETNANILARCIPLLPTQSYGLAAARVPTPPDRVRTASLVCDLKICKSAGFETRTCRHDKEPNKKVAEVSTASAAAGRRSGLIIVSCFVLVLALVRLTKTAAGYLSCLSATQI